MDRYSFIMNKNIFITTVVLFFILFILNAGIITAQGDDSSRSTNSVNGYVYYDDIEQPGASVSIYLKEDGGDWTLIEEDNADAYGYFSFFGLDDGVYAIEASGGDIGGA